MELKEMRKLDDAITFSEIKDLAIGGLLTDGGHHKQWYLERILEVMGVNLDDLRQQLNAEDYDWDEGIAP